MVGQCYINSPQVKGGQGGKQSVSAANTLTRITPALAISECMSLISSPVATGYYTGTFIDLPNLSVCTSIANTGVRWVAFCK